MDRYILLNIYPFPIHLLYLQYQVKVKFLNIFVYYEKENYIYYTIDFCNLYHTLNKKRTCAKTHKFFSILFINRHETYAAWGTRQNCPNPA